MLKKIRHFFVALLMATTLASCGFTAQPNTTVPPELHNLTLTTNSPYSDFTRKITEALNFANVNILPQGQAPFVLQISATGPDYNTPLIVTSSQARIYRLTYQVTFSILDTQGNIVYPQQAIITERELILAPNQLLGTNNQAESLTTAMQQEAIFRVFSQLNSPNMKNAIDEYLAKQNKHKRKRKHHQ